VHPTAQVTAATAGTGEADAPPAATMGPPALLAATPTAGATAATPIAHSDTRPTVARRHGVDGLVRSEVLLTGARLLEIRPTR
jgi:hypothetical protein